MYSSRASRLYDSLSQRVTAANTNNAEFFISIHHNLSTGGEGTEVYSMKGGRGEEVANNILKEIVELGFKDRGVKDGSGLFIINRTIMPAILIECAFCDSANDMRNYDTDKMAEAIFTGVCKAFEVTKPDTVAIYHTVIKGDILWGISRNNGVSLNDIVTLNGIRVASVIEIGQKIRIR